jgi:hypothetical protein
MLLRSLCATLAALMLGPCVANAVILPPGEPPNLALWDPAIWRSALPLRTNRSVCSAHAIGYRAIVTAANCIADDPQVTIRLADESIKAVCERHPAFGADPRLDIALCLVERPMPGISIERVNTDPKLIRTSAPVYVVGFGCRLPGGLDRGFGTLNGGYARLEEPERGRSSGVVSWIVAGAMLCAGDAGGGTFSDVERGVGARLLLGVNSRTDYANRSWIAITASNDFLLWARAWGDRNGAPICGVHQQLQACTTETVQLDPLRARLASAGDDQLDVPLTRQIKVVPRKDETLNQLIRRACGEEGPEFKRQAERLVSSPLDAPLKAEGEISIPLCSLRAPELRYREQMVKSGDTVWKFFEGIVKTGSLTRWRDYKAPPGMAATTAERDYFWNAFQKLNPTVNLDALPLNSIVRIPLVPEPPEVGRAVTATVPGTTQPIFPVPQAAAAGACRVAAPPTGHPYDVSSLLDVLLLNHRARIAGNKPKRSRANVVIADSGLFGGGSGVFRFGEVLIPLPAQSKWEEYLGEVDPLTEGPEPMHGTQVASLALGGPLFARFLSASVEPQIGLVIARVYRKYSSPARPDYYGVVDQVFEKIVKNAAQDDVRVVNVSMKTTAPIPAFNPHLNAGSSLLFVVAAGNFDGQLGKEFSNDVYPANYGGVDNSGKFNLLTVGGLDNDQTMAPFSNYSADHVEIAAPSCHIPAIEYNTTERIWSGGPSSGTSMAAPLVSFVAALARSEKGTGWKGIDIKRRLLASADLDSGLLKKVHDGRKLNAVKALSLYSDVVEANNKLLFGQVTFSLNGVALTDDQQIPLSCTTGDFPARVGQILKLVPQFKNLHDKVVIKVYTWDGSDVVLTNRECTLPPGINVTLVVRDENRNMIQGFDLEQVTDYVRREFK